MTWCASPAVNGRRPRTLPAGCIASSSLTPMNPRPNCWLPWPTRCEPRTTSTWRAASRSCSARGSFTPTNAGRSGSRALSCSPLAHFARARRSLRPRTLRTWRLTSPKWASALLSAQCRGLAGGHCLAARADRAGPGQLRGLAHRAVVGPGTRAFSEPGQAARSRKTDSLAGGDDYSFAWFATLGAKPSGGAIRGPLHSFPAPLRANRAAALDHAGRAGGMMTDNKWENDR